MRPALLLAGTFTETRQENRPPCLLYVPATPKLDIIFKNFFETECKEAPATEMVAGALN